MAGPLGEERAAARPGRLTPAPRALGVAIVVLVLAANVYRAATQAITHDEAMGWHVYVVGPWQALLFHFDANHHILHTLLCRLSVGALGDSPFTLRLPSVLGGLVYLLCARALCVRLLADPWLALLAQGLLSLNPFVLDYLSIGRGYGMAVGLWLAGMAPLCTYLDAVRSAGLRAARLRHVAWASTCFGLAVMANLTLLVMCTATALAVAVAALRAKDVQVRALLALAWAFITPPVFVLLALGLPLLGVRVELFYVGTLTLWTSLLSLVSPALAYHARGSGVGTSVAAALALAAFLGALALAWRRRHAATSIPLALSTLMLLFATALVLALHFALDRPYPGGRTGLYFVPPFTLCLVLAQQELERLPRAWRHARMVGRALLLCVLARLLLQFQVHEYRAFRLDADNESVLAALADLRAEVGRPLRLACLEVIYTSLSYYRPARDPEFAAFHFTVDPAATYDAYVVAPDYMRVVERRGDAQLLECRGSDGQPALIWLAPRWRAASGVVIARRVEPPR